jgi:hypothetical protein
VLNYLGVKNQMDLTEGFNAKIVTQFILNNRALILKLSMLKYCPNRYKVEMGFEKCPLAPPYTLPHLKT